MCGHEYDYDYDDEEVCSDIVDGQYIEFYTVQCPECGHHNRT